jgi:hypothetical protein
LSNQKRLFGEIYGIVFGRDTNFLETTLRLGVYLDNAPIIEAIFSVIMNIVNIKTQIISKIN